MSDVIYTSHVHIERIGEHSAATLPELDEPVLFGMHGPLASHYGLDPAEPRAATLDYIVAAAGG